MKREKAVYLVRALRGQVRIADEKVSQKLVTLEISKTKGSWAADLAGALFISRHFEIAPEPCFSVTFIGSGHTSLDQLWVRK